MAKVNSHRADLPIVALAVALAILAASLAVVATQAIRTAPEGAVQADQVAMTILRAAMVR